MKEEEMTRFARTMCIVALCEPTPERIQKIIEILKKKEKVEK